METLKLSIRVLAGRALKISNRVSIRALKLSNFERLRTLKISNRVSFRALKLSKRATEPVCSLGVGGWVREKSKLMLAQSSCAVLASDRKINL